MSPSRVPTSMPSTAVTLANSGTAPSPSPALSARTSTPRTSSEASSIMTSSFSAAVPIMPRRAV
jgi:hypothetical protein